MTTTLCAVCGSERTERCFREFASRYNQTPVSIAKAEMYECSDCGERFFTPEQSKALSLAIREEVRKKEGLLSPGEIVAIREKLGLTQHDLETLFGLGSKVVTRWETGRVIQSRAADVALRLLAMAPYTLEQLRKERNQTKVAG
jgi:putative zinc finger/helix-turn-helix YgiT family protein